MQNREQELPEMRKTIRKLGHTLLKPALANKPFPLG
jgi:hypothetical protein